MRSVKTSHVTEVNLVRAKNERIFIGKIKICEDVEVSNARDNMQNARDNMSNAGDNTK